MATKTFITKENLAKYSSLVKAAIKSGDDALNSSLTSGINRAQTTADNAMTIASGAVTEAQKKIGIGTLATINGQSIENGGNIELDFTVAEIVTALPAVASASKSKIYLVPSSASEENNTYSEYIKVTVDGTDKFEKIGEYKANIAVDNAISSTSTNPVQNKVIYQALEDQDNAMTAHINDKNNPHSVTKAQVGLGNVDNTADKDKPVSTATSNALNTKVDKVTGKGLSTNDYTDSEKSKLASIAANANNYSLPLAASGTRGGIQIGYTANGKNYPVQLSSEKAFVNVPWTDTTYHLNVEATAAKGVIILFDGGGQTTPITIPAAVADKTSGGSTVLGTPGVMTGTDKTRLDNLYTIYGDPVDLTDEEITTLWNEAE